jgi:large subunit ribosomal protein L23
MAKKEGKEKKEDKPKKEEKKKEEKREGSGEWKVLMYPQLAEKSMNMVEMENKLIFIVKRNSRKGEIKEDIEKAFGVRVEDVNVMITRKGQKKAIIKLHPDDSAADIASQLGML